MRARLSGRFSLALIEEAVDVLKSKGLLDDATFARMWRQSRERHRPRGISAVRWELLRKGVAREVVEDALDGMDEDKNAWRAACGTLGRLGQADYDTFRKKLVAYLRRRGFGAGTIMGTVERLWRELSHSAYRHEERRAHNEQPKDAGDWSRD